MIKWLQEKRVTDISKLQQLKERFLTGVELSTYAESGHRDGRAFVTGTSYSNRYEEVITQELVFCSKAI